MADANQDNDKRELERRWDVEELLQKSGAQLLRHQHQTTNVRLCCPYCHEDKGHLYVVADRSHPRYGRWRCYRADCDQRGHLWTLLLTLRGQNFWEVKKWVAGEVGYTLSGLSREVLPPEERKQRALKWYVKWGQEQLNESPEAIAYLLERGVSIASWHRFRLGYAPLQPRFSELKNRHTDPVTFESLQEAGVMRQKADGTPGHWFRQRVLFPIMNGKEVEEITGRTLSDNPDLPKYLNLTGKPKGVYGADTITAESEIVFLGEGPFDALLSAQEGVASLALLGSSLQESLPLLVSHLPHKVGLCLGMDSDIKAEKIDAYSKALMERGIPVSVMTSYDGANDAAELIARYVQAQDHAAWRNRVIACETYPTWAARRIDRESYQHPMTASRPFLPLLRLLKRVDAVFAVSVLSEMVRALQEQDPACPITLPKLAFYLQHLA